MVLDLATFLTLATACAPSVAPTTLLAVARVESGLDPLAIGVNGSAPPRRRAQTIDEAVRRAERLMAAGRDIDLGLAQINVRNLTRLRLTVAEAFDPCRNLQASARLLTDSYQRALPTAGSGQAALRVALSVYNTGRPDRGLQNGYVARVVAQAAGATPGRFDPVDEPPSPAPVPVPAPSWDVFGRARVIPADLVVRPAPGVQP